MERSSQKALVVLSGGQDSTTCLYWALERFGEVAALTFNYGQRHHREIEAARVIAARIGVHHEIVEVPRFGGDSPLTRRDLEVGKYGGPDDLPGGVEPTFVPGRNLVFLAIAASRAETLGCKAVVTGVSQEDYGGYPDCRAEFVGTMEAAANLALGRDLADRLLILAPLIDKTKAATVRMAASLPGCMAAMALTHTCYEGTSPPCGECHACVLRAKGFEEAGVDDPLLAG